ncbi:MBL fold metallo-hydrolase [Gordonia desulfuricans]|uniref:MBL fold metallo-hydrolase n=2 Tax=Gordonia desulfuricans TaxID=89051 RepID=A0A7K3LM64_9ACTN|nr:MBL fold metallo-hydrolase [Gordonia desulfuricans]
MLRGLRAPSLDPWRHLESPPAAAGSEGRVQVRFLGVSTLLLTDGTSTILTDGFFTRPGLVRVRAGRVRPDRTVIRAALDRFGIGTVDAVFVVHSHYDHALDSADVAEMTGARLLGSASMRNIARGHGFPDDRFDLVALGEPRRIGAFTLTALPAEHSPGDLAPGSIDAPMSPGAKATDYRTGDCYTLHIEHHGRELMIHASANMRAGAITGRHAETVYLGIGVLGKQTPGFRDAYWQTFVTDTGARTVIPIHWDNFTRGLDRPLTPLPEFFDDFTTSMEFLTSRADGEGVRLELPVLGRVTDPFVEKYSS